MTETRVIWRYDAIIQEYSKARIPQRWEDSVASYETWDVWFDVIRNLLEAQHVSATPLIMITIVRDIKSFPPSTHTHLNYYIPLQLKQLFSVINLLKSHTDVKRLHFFKYPTVENGGSHTNCTEVHKRYNSTEKMKSVFELL